MAEKFKVSKQLFGKKTGLKIEGKQFLKKQYKSIKIVEINQQTSIAIVEDENYKFFVVDLNKKQILPTSSSTFVLRPVYKMIYDQKQQSNVKQIDHYMLIKTYVKINNFEYAVVGNQAKEEAQPVFYPQNPKRKRQQNQPALPTTKKQNANFKNNNFDRSM